VGSHASEPYAISKALQWFLRLSPEDLYICDGGLRAPFSIWLLHVGKHFESELRQVGRDFEFEGCTVREVFGNGLMMRV
jgi:hypothetical protein